jgi:hypothetical protein
MIFYALYKKQERKYFIINQAIKIFFILTPFLLFLYRVQLLFLHSPNYGYNY